MVATPSRGKGKRKEKKKGLPPIDLLLSVQDGGRALGGEGRILTWAALVRPLCRGKEKKKEKPSITPWPLGRGKKGKKGGKAGSRLYILPDFERKRGKEGSAYSGTPFP